MVMRWLLLLFVAAFAELTLLLRLADAWGWGRVLAWILVTGFLGTWFFRRGGMQSFSRMNEELQSGSHRALTIVESALLVFSGLLLVLPGVMTDLAGFALLLPPLRRRIAQRMIRRFHGKFTVFRANRAGTFVDVEAVGTPSSGGQADHATHRALFPKEE